MSDSIPVRWTVIIREGTGSPTFLESAFIKKCRLKTAKVELSAVANKKWGGWMVVARECISIAIGLGNGIIDEPVFYCSYER
jgi:hypothetical protein